MGGREWDTTLSHSLRIHHLWTTWEMLHFERSHYSINSYEAVPKNTIPFIQLFFLKNNEAWKAISASTKCTTSVKPSSRNPPFLVRFPNPLPQVIPIHSVPGNFRHNAHLSILVTIHHSGNIDLRRLCHSPCWTKILDIIPKDTMYVHNMKYRIQETMIPDQPCGRSGLIYYHLFYNIR